MSVLTENREGVLVLTINRPEAGNSLNPAVGQGFVDALTDAATNPEVRSIIVTGSGERVFCAGMDLKAFAAGEDMAPVGAGLAVAHRLPEARDRRRQRLGRRRWVGSDDARRPGRRRRPRPVRHPRGQARPRGRRRRNAVADAHPAADGLGDGSHRRDDHGPTGTRARSHQSCRARSRRDVDGTWRWLR